jgi:hypothetical protein
MTQVNQSSTQENPSSGQGRSLHIGVNEVNGDHYSGWTGPLKLCENDVSVMQSVATDLGFKTETLKTKEATRDNVSKAIGRISSELKDGDMFLITYAGHGGQVADVNGDEDDLKDETWCLYDGQLLDDELAMLWSKFDPGVRIVVISDSCNSGSIAKSMIFPEDPAEQEAFLATLPPHDRADRAMPRKAARSTFKDNKSMYAEIQYALPSPMPPIQATVRQLSGCVDGQKSYDGENQNGLFTETVVRTFNGGQFEGDYGAFFKAIHKQMPVWQKPATLVAGAPNKAFDRQKPLSV